jgi:hypothetical protein
MSRKHQVDQAYLAAEAKARVEIDRQASPPVKPALASSPRKTTCSPSGE